MTGVLLHLPRDRGAVLVVSLSKALWLAILDGMSCEARGGSGCRMRDCRG